MTHQESPFHHILAFLDFEIEDNENALEGFPGNDNDLDYALEDAKKTGVDIHSELKEFRAGMRLLELAGAIPFDKIMKAKGLILK